MLGILGKLLDSNEREIKRLKPVVAVIGSFEKKVSKLTDPELKETLLHFKKEYEKGKSLDEFLPEVFARVREVAKRSIKQRHFDVQLMAAIALFEGKVAEQRTGEGNNIQDIPPACSVRRDKRVYGRRRNNAFRRHRDYSACRG